MSDQQDPIAIAKKAEQDLNSYAAKQGHDASSSTVQSGRGASDSTTESGVDESVTAKFPGSTVTYGTGRGDNREIPLEEGGDENPRTGQLYKSRDFEGEGGPEDKAANYAAENPGNDDVRGNIRQGGETSRPLGGQLPSEDRR